MRFPGINSRAMVAAVGAIAVVVLVLAFAANFWALAALPLLTNSLLAFVWLLAAFGIGWPIVHILIPKTEDALSIVTSIAVGLGVMSLAVLALGLAAWLNQATAITLLVAGCVAAVRPLWRLRSKIESWLGEPASRAWLWLIALWPAAVAAICALVPPGVLWGDEPNGYDVVEYHLQIPRQWFELGRIVPLKENVFSYFPQGMEMHYLLAMHLCGGPWAGMYLTQFMHAAMCALAVAAIAAAGGMRAGLIAAVTPWITLLAPMAYVEGVTLLFGALAIAWAIRSEHWREMAVAGLLAGFACGVKLTCVPTILVAIPIAALVASRANAVKKTAAFLIAATVAFSPWLLRTFLWAGNPVFPEAMNLFGRAHFTAVQVERWRRAYLPTTPRLTGLFEQIIADWRYGYILIAVALIAAGLTLRSRQTRFLLAMLAILMTFWLGLTHLQSRFFVLAIPVCALLIAQTRNGLLAAAVIGVLLAVNIFRIGGRLEDYETRGYGQLLGLEGLHDLVQPDVRMLARDTRIDLVGGVNPFWFELPTARLGYRTVFDVDTSDPSRSIVEDWLAGPSTPQSNRLIVIDVGELARLARTYYGIPQLTDAELQALSRRGDVIITGQH